MGERIEPYFGGRPARSEPVAPRPPETPSSREEQEEALILSTEAVDEPIRSTPEDPVPQPPKTVRATSSEQGAAQARFDNGPRNEGPQTPGRTPLGKPEEVPAWSEIPFYRKRWFVFLMIGLVGPIGALIVWIGPVYYRDRTTKAVEALSHKGKVIATLSAGAVILLYIAGSVDSGSGCSGDAVNATFAQLMSELPATSGSYQQMMRANQYAEAIVKRQMAAEAAWLRGDPATACQIAAQAQRDFGR